MIEALKVEFLKSINLDNYNERVSHDSMDKVMEICRMHLMLPIKHKPRSIKIEGIENFILLSDNKIQIDYIVKQSGDDFILFEMDLKTYNEFEKFVSSKL